MDTDWRPIPDLHNVGHLTYFLSSRQSDLPIRRVERGVDYGHKKEPHYENMTYGDFSCCICDNRVKAVQEGRKYMFFATQYYGNVTESRNKICIVGYYRLTSYHPKRHFHNHKPARNPCVAVRADKRVFVKIENAFELTDEVWQRWFRKRLPRTIGDRPFLQGIVRSVYQSGLEEKIAKEIVEHLEPRDASEEYVRETQRLSEA